MQGVGSSSRKWTALLDEPPGQAKPSQAEQEEYQGCAADLGLVMDLRLCRLWLNMASVEDFCKGAQVRSCPWGLALLSPYSPSALDSGTAKKP